MGYRNYLGVIPKKEYNKIKKMTKEELFSYKNEDIEDGYVGPYKIVDQIYEYGKYCEFETDNYFSKFFKNKELSNYMLADHDFYIVQKEFLEMTINNYNERIKKYYTKMLDGVEDMLENKAMTFEKQVELYDHIRSMSSEWLQLTPYKLDGRPSITTSWKYEYEIFELVRIYKTFDWKKNIMVYYGY